VLFTVLVITFVARVIGPRLDTVSVLLVLHPLTRVLSAVHVDVAAPAVRLVIEPLSFVDIAIGVDQTAFTVSHVIAPVAFVLGAVFPDLETAPMSQAVRRPLTTVDSAVVQLVGATCHQVMIKKLFFSVVVFKGSKVSFGVFGCRVGIIGHFCQLLGVDETIASALVATQILHATALEAGPTATRRDFSFHLAHLVLLLFLLGSKALF